MHVKSAIEGVYVPLGQVEFLVDESQAYATPVGGIGDAGIVVGKTVFPPSHSCLVQEGDTCYKRTDIESLL